MAPRTKLSKLSKPIKPRIRKPKTLLLPVTKGQTFINKLFPVHSCPQLPKMPDSIPSSPLHKVKQFKRVSKPVIHTGTLVDLTDADAAESKPYSGLAADLLTPTLDDIKESVDILAQWVEHTKQTQTLLTFSDACKDFNIVEPKADDVNRLFWTMQQQQQSSSRTFRITDEIMAYLGFTESTHIQRQKHLQQLLDKHNIPYKLVRERSGILRNYYAVLTSRALASLFLIPELPRAQYFSKLSFQLKLATDCYLAYITLRTQQALAAAACQQ